MYCKIFVNYQGDKPTLLNVLAKELQAKSIDINTLLFPWGDLYISCNDEYDPKKVQRTDGFLYYLYLLDMEITTTDYVAITDTILDYLRQQGVEAVAACDYEEKLRKQWKNH